MRHLRVLDLVGPAQVGIETAIAAQGVEHRGAIDDAGRHQVDDALLAALHLAFGQHQPRRHDGAAIAFEMARP